MALQLVALLDLLGRAHQQLLERGHAGVGHTGLAGDVEELAAVVKRHHAQLVPLGARRGDAVQVGQLLVGVGFGIALAAEPVGQLLRRRHGGRAGVARHHDGAAGVGHAGRFGPVLALQQAGHQARQKGVARAQHVQHLDALALEGGGVVDGCGNGALDHAAAQRAALDHQRGGRDPAHLAQAGHQVAGHTAGDEELFLGAHQQLEVAQHLLQLLGDAGVRHIAVVAGATAREAPQHRAVVDVQHADHAMLLGVGQRGGGGLAGGGR